MHWRYDMENESTIIDFCRLCVNSAFIQVQDEAACQLGNRYTHFGLVYAVYTYAHDTDC